MPGIEPTINRGRLGLRASQLALLTAMLFLPAGGSRAVEPGAFEGEWRSEGDAQGIVLSVSRESGGHRVRVQSDSAPAFDAVLVADPRPGIFAEARAKGGIMGMLGLGSNEEDIDVLDGTPISWARDHRAGLILYRVQILDGRYAIDRILLGEPADDGLTLEIWQQRHGEEARVAVVTLNRGP